MKFKQTCTVVGLKASKGTLESGQAYDSTKAFVLMDMDASKGRMKGQSCTEFNIGTSDVFDQLAKVVCPFQADIEFELVTTGSSTRTNVTGIKPLPAAGKV